MKKLSFKILSLLLLLSVFMVGCGNKDKETSTKDTSAGNSKTVDFEGRTLNVVTTSDAYVDLFNKFAEKTNCKVEFLSMSSGEVLAKVKAEGGTPMADLWFGGGLDAFMDAKNEGLLDSYKSDATEKVDSKYKDSEGYWYSKGLTVVGFLVNNDVIKDKNLEIPKSWSDLADEKYKGEVIMSDPSISGTNYAALKGLLDMYGEEEGWKYIEKLNANIDFYGKRGKDPQEKTSAGEFGVGIIPVDKSSFDLAKDNNLTVVYPEDGIPWVPEGVAVFKDSKNADIAKAFIDFMLEDANLEELAKLDGKDTNQIIKSGIKGFDLGLPADKLIKEDLSTFGTSRETVLNKWKEIAGNKASVE
ncbi:ABC transporter substrate-binding protein [Miniphocaeibacter massiliensis]|uniref:ABC transporter substrate-binding protein n=1 Tax=Miniphocaeibacter massiliensis TaxID=2041841 RepID=UPI000C1BE4FB|nr:ABC transporter substrate-binding protein [Miniphocaeibacter massiliensis]